MNWQSKCEKYFNNKTFTNKYVEHGLKFEKEALLQYRIENKCEVYEPGFIVCDKHPWLGYSPDGVVYFEEKPRKLLEIKCPYIGTIRS